MPYLSLPPVFVLDPSFTDLTHRDEGHAKLCGKDLINGIIQTCELQIDI